ncbi:MAG: hypothetical protein QF805_00115, partial [Pirellulaceae bacterium]|nr:hypothetical protein [Pirellulaceae bacterium]
LLTGQSPLETGSLDSPLKKMTALATQSAPSLGAMRTDLPNDLVRLVDGMLSREPHDRLNDPAEIAERLEPLAQASDLPRLLRAARACPENKAKGFPDDIVSRAERRSPRKLNPFVAALVALLLMGVGAAGVIVIRLADNRGELVIDSEADVRVVVKQLDGPHEADLSIQKGVNSIQLQAGDYRVDVESQRNDELVIEGSTFEIVRDGKAIARIEHRPDRVKLPAAGQGSSGQANSGATNIGATKTGEATFDGRTLADWKRQLRTELHPQRLDEAVSAMVALSRDREAEVAAEFAALAHRVSDSQAGSVRFSARSRSGALRKSAATGLIALPVPAIAPHVEQMLNSKTPQVVYIAIYVLQDSVETHPAPAEFKALAPKLMELTEAGHSDVRAMALSALAKIDFELIRKQLFDSLLADDLGVWKMAYSLIESVLPDDPARYDALRKRLRRYDPERDSRDELVALMQICASANRRVPFDDQFVEPLMRIIEHPSDEIGKTLDHSTLSARGAACQILSSMDALARSALPRLQELRQERIDALRKTSSRSGRFDPRGTPDDQALAAAVSKISRAVRELESQEVAPKQ